MGGVLTHVAIAILSGALAFFLFRNYFIAAGVLIGNLITDSITWSITMLRQGTINIPSIKHDAAFYAIADLVSNPVNWFALAFVLSTIGWILYHKKKISRETFDVFEETVFALIVGVITHLVIDLFVLESFWWL